MLLSTREWTISTTATLAAMEIWSHLIASWTVDLYWKSRIMAWPASARPAKMTTRTHSMRVSQVHLCSRGAACFHIHKYISYCCISNIFWLVQTVSLFFRKALDGSWTAHIWPTSSPRDSEGWCVQFWHHTAGDSPKEWTLLCWRHGPQPQR